MRLDIDPIVRDYIFILVDNEFFYNMNIYLIISIMDKL